MYFNNLNNKIKVPIINETINLVKLRSNRTNKWSIYENNDIYDEDSELNKDPEEPKESNTNEDLYQYDDIDINKYENIVEMITELEYHNFSSLTINNNEYKIKKNNDEFLLFNKDEDIQNMKLLGIIKNNSLILF